MNLLLDTHALLWLVTEPDRLGPAAAKALADPDHGLWVSMASVWEGEIKRAKGTLDLPSDLWDVLAGQGVVYLDLTLQHCRAAADLPHHHRDPFDRMLVAQALSDGMTLVTADRQLAACGVPVLW